MKENKRINTMKTVALRIQEKVKNYVHIDYGKKR